jgi:MYXO-CTERM domain-containing protein
MAVWRILGEIWQSKMENRAKYSGAPLMKNFAVLCSLALAASATLQAGNLNIDFGSYFAPPSNSYGAAALQAGTWNWITSTGTTSNLVDLSGNPTSVSVNVTAQTMGGWSDTGTTDIAHLRASNFFSMGAPWSVLFSNLDNGTYSLYYYAPTNGALSTGNFTANGVAISSIKGSSSATLNQGTDWDVRSGIQVTGGSLLLTSDVLGGYEGLAGLQLVQGQGQVSTPEPTSLLLAGSALLGIAALRRRRS